MPVATKYSLAARLAMVLLAVATNGAARADDDREYVPPVETHLIPSRHVDQTFKIQVMQPSQKRGDKTRYPVVYATDGNLFFDALKGISQALQLQIGEPVAPRFILVGIGYPSESPWAGSVLRGRDMTFPGFPDWTTGRKDPPPWEDVPDVPTGTPGFAGGEAFQEFIADELIPLIDGKFRTIPGERTYFGHSAGAGFGLITLFDRPELFKNYILVSPFLVMETAEKANGEYADFGLRATRRFLASGRALPNVKLYLSVGTNEELDPVRKSMRFTSSFYRLTALLKTSEVRGLMVTAEAFTGESHMTAWPIGFMHGVQAVFATGAWKDSEAR